MQNDILASLTRLSDAELVGQLKSFIARERDATAQIVARIVELDTRDIHLREGYSSLYVYCRDALGLSEWEAYNRIEVARAARRFPVILDMLTRGSVNLTAVRLLAPHLTPSNHREVLESARGKRKPAVEEIVARLSPRPDVAPSVRKLPAPMLGHAIPSGDDAAILDRALTTLLVDLAKKKFADTRRPRPSRGTKPGAHDASAAVKRAVWVRDLGRCAFIGTNGHRCNERRFIEFHHVDPYVLGGEATVDQIELRCRRHNDYEGRLYFGKRRRGGDNGVVREEPARYRYGPSEPGELVLEQVDLSVAHSIS